METLLYIGLFIFMVAINLGAIKSHTSNGLQLWVSGLIIASLAPVIGFLSGSVFVWIDNGQGGSGVGGALGGAFIGLIILANGLLYFLIGLGLGIARKVKQNQAN